MSELLCECGVVKQEHFVLRALNGKPYCAQLAAHSIWPLAFRLARRMDHPHALAQDLASEVQMRAVVYGAPRSRYAVYAWVKQVLPQAISDYLGWRDRHDIIDLNNPEIEGLIKYGDRLGWYLERISDEEYSRQLMGDYGKDSQW